MSNTFGNCASGSVAAPTMVATIVIRVRLLRRLPRIWLAIHSSTSMIDADRLGRRPALDRGVRRQRDGARRHRQAGGGSGMVHDGLGQQIVEHAIVAALGGGIVDLEQRFGFGAADRLMLDRGRGQDARAPGGVIGIQHAGKMHAAPGGRAFAGDHAIAHDRSALRRRCCGRKSSGRSRAAIGSAGLGGRGRHWYTSLFLISFAQHFHAGVNEWLTIRNLVRVFFRWLLIGRCDVRHGSGIRNRAAGDAAS